MRDQGEFNGQIKAIFRGGKILPIQWGEEFQAWPVAERLAYAMELASAMNQAADVIQEERNALMAEAIQLREAADNANQLAQTHRGLATKMILESNQQRQAHAAAIGEASNRVAALEQELRDLRG